MLGPFSSNAFWAALRARYRASPSCFTSARTSSSRAARMSGSGSIAVHSVSIVTMEDAPTSFQNATRAVPVSRTLDRCSARHPACAKRSPPVLFLIESHAQPVRKLNREDATAGEFAGALHGTIRRNKGEFASHNRGRREFATLYHDAARMKLHPAIGLNVH